VKWKMKLCFKELFSFFGGLAWVSNQSFQLSDVNMLALVQKLCTKPSGVRIAPSCIYIYIYCMYIHLKHKSKNWSELDGLNSIKFTCNSGVFLVTGGRHRTEIINNFTEIYLKW